MPADAEPTQDRTSSTRTSVVLFRAPGAVIPPKLAQALARNSTDPIEVDHALAAMAILCTTRPAVLLLCDPEELLASRELLSAVERYIPKATRWEYVPDQDPPLRPVEIRSPEPESQSQSVTRADSFALRLSSGSHAARTPSPVIPSEVLTRDEMEALFSEDPR